MTHFLPFTFRSLYLGKTIRELNFFRFSIFFLSVR